MDDLLSELLTEINESLNIVDVELVQFERERTMPRFSTTFFVWFTPSREPVGFWGCLASNPWPTPPKPL